jgi:hypothetical protein
MVYMGVGFENRVFKKVFSPIRQELTGDWRKYSSGAARLVFFTK